MAKKACSKKKTIKIHNKRGTVIATFRGRQGADCPKRRNPPKGKTPARLHAYAEVMAEASPACNTRYKSRKAVRACIRDAFKGVALSNRRRARRRTRR